MRRYAAGGRRQAVHFLGVSLDKTSNNAAAAPASTQTQQVARRPSDAPAKIGKYEIRGEIGRALGVEYDDDEELQGGDEIAARDRHRWELDPESKDDFDDEA